MTVKVSHSFPASVDQIGPWRSIAESLLRTWTGTAEPCEGIQDLLLAMQEAVTNVIRHAYAGMDDVDGDEQRVEVGLQFDQTCVEVSVRDWGHPFDPESIPEPDFDDPTPGGYGVYIMKSVTDAFSYTREGSCNVLRVRKNLLGSSDEVIA